MSKYVIELSPFIPVPEQQELSKAQIIGKKFDCFEDAQTEQAIWCYHNEIATSKFRIIETE